MKRFVLSLLASAILFNIYGQSLVTDRPDQTESSVTVPLNSLQIESGFIFGINNIANREFNNIAFPTSLFRYGLTEGIELRVFSQVESLKESESSNPDRSVGFNDLEFGIKIQLLNQEDRKTQLALLTHLIVPTGSENHSIGEIGFFSKLAASYPINETTGIGYNIGYGYFGSGSGDLLYSLVFGFGLSDKLGLFLEVYGEFENFDSFNSSFDSGLTWLLKENFQLDFSFGTGINLPMNFISTGFSWNINNN